MSSPLPLPLTGIKVLDFSTLLPGPVCSLLLAEAGAEVIKVELPKVGDPTRKFGTPTSCGDSLIWLSEGRNKKSITIDLRKKEGADLYRRECRTGAGSRKATGGHTGLDLVQ